MLETSCSGVLTFFPTLPALGYHKYEYCYPSSYLSYYVPSQSLLLSERFHNQLIPFLVMARGQLKN